MDAQKLTLVRGDTGPLTFTATITGQEAAAYQNFWFTIKRSSADADVDALASITPTLTNPTASTAAILSVIIPASTFTDAPDWDYRVEWDCRGKDASGYIFTLAYGSLVILGSRNMTRAS